MRGSCTYSSMALTPVFLDWGGYSVGNQQYIDISGDPFVGVARFVVYHRIH